MRLLVTTFIGVVFGFLLRVSFPSLSLSQMNLPSSLFPSIDLTYIEDKCSGLSTEALLDAFSSLRGFKRGSTQAYLYNDTEIWAPTNPRGAERLPPGIIASESDFYLRQLWGLPSEDLIIKPRYLVTFTVGYDQKKNIDAAVKKVEQVNGKNLSGQSGLSMWYAKQFLHPDIVAPYNYIFMWDEDLGVEHFNAEEYIKLVRKHGLEISQPGLELNKGLTWQMTKRRGDSEVHNNDLVHGWGLDSALQKCVKPAHEKIGVVDAQWIVHQGVPSLGNQGQAESGRAPWEGVRERCRREWTMFQDRMNSAEKAYYESMGIEPPNSTAP